MAEEMQGAPQGSGSFPKGDAEGEQFILQLVKFINSDDEVARIMQEEAGGKAPMSTILGAVAAQLLTLLFSKLHEQTGGQKVSKQYVVQIIRVAVRELADIASASGQEVSQQDEQQAAKVAGDSLDESMKSLYSGGAQQAPQEQQAPQGQPQAPQGVMQGQPQGAGGM